MEIEERPDELYHYGRLGMKWGKHIFGKDKAGSAHKKKASRTDQGEDGGSSSSGSRGSVDGISTEELKKRTERLNAEKNYYDAERNRKNSYDQLHPKPKPKESFMNKFVNDAVKPAVIEAGKKQIERLLNKQIEELTKEKLDPNSWEALKKNSEKAAFKMKIAESTKKMHEANDWIKEREEKIKNADKDKSEKEAKEQAMRDYEDFQKQEAEAREGGYNAYEYVYNKTGSDIVDRVWRDDSNFHPPAVSSPTSSSRSAETEAYVQKLLGKDDFYSPVVSEPGKVASNEPKAKASETSQHAARAYVDAVLDKYGDVVVTYDKQGGSSSPKGSGSSRTSETDTDYNSRLSKSAGNWTRQASESSAAATKADSGKAYVDELLKKMGKRKG